MLWKYGSKNSSHSNEKIINSKVGTANKDVVEEIQVNNMTKYNEIEEKEKISEKDDSKLFFNPITVMSSQIANEIKKIIESKDKQYKIESWVNYSGEKEYTINKFANGKPLYSYSTEPGSFNVSHFSHWVNSDAQKAIKYFTNLGLIKYSDYNYDISTIRFKNKSDDLYIMIQPVENNRIYIVYSKVELVDESE